MPPDKGEHTVTETGHIPTKRELEEKILDELFSPNTYTKESIMWKEGLRVLGNLNRADLRVLRVLRLGRKPMAPPCTC